ncbi:hypothetical protein GCK32_013814, partial [Trichostrongylus colubriformis]
SIPLFRRLAISRRYIFQLHFNIHYRLRRFDAQYQCNLPGFVHYIRSDSGNDHHRFRSR